MNTKILLLEDLDSFAETIREGLQSKHKQLGRVEIIRIATELEFRRRLPELSYADFDVAIFDVMVGWCSIEDLDTEAGTKPPQAVDDEREGKAKWRSGVRCRKLFAEEREKAKSRPVPCLFYTVLDEDNLEGELNGDTPLIVKHGELDPLVSAILKATGRY